MKIKFLLLMIISAIALTACGTTKPTTAKNETEATTEVSNEEIILQEDGTYYVSDEVREKFRISSDSVDLTEEEFERFLQTFLQKVYPLEQNVDNLLLILEDAVAKRNTENTETEQSTETNNKIGKVIARDEVRGVTCSQEMLEAVHKSLERVNLDNKWTMNVLFGYLEVGDDTKVDTVVIDNIVDSIKKELVAQEKAEQAQQEQAQQNQNNNNNNGGGSSNNGGGNNSGGGNSNNGGGNNSGGNSNEAPSDWVTPEKEDAPSGGGNDGPGPGEYARPSIGDGGDGGDLVGDTVLNP